MKTNWKTKLNEVKRKRYTIPEGWETREQVAAQLECAPDRVDKLLKPGIDDGSFERRMFAVWDEARRMAVQVSCYRMAGGDVKPQGNSIDDRIRACILRNPSKPNNRIAKNFAGINSAYVQQIRETL
jgi:hypothetical protein